MTDLHHFYSARKNELTEECRRLKKQIQKISIARIILASLFLSAGYFGFTNSSYWYLLIPLALGFVYLVSKHSKIRDQYDLNQGLANLNDLEIKALENDYSSFPDGAEFTNPHHAYSYDLDLFGIGSLFQYLNRCGTAIGEQKLATDLTHSQTSLNSITERQDAIRELAADHVDLRQWFWVQGHLLQDNSRENENLLGWLVEQDEVFGKSVYRILLILFPLISLLLIGLTIYIWSYFPLIILFSGVQWMVISLKSKEVSKAEVALGHHKTVLDKYARLLSNVARSTFKTSRLKAIQNEANNASIHIKKFSQLVNAFESRKNGIASMFGNSLYLYDLQCLFRLERWRSLHKESVRGWFEKIAEIDALISFATFHFNNQNNCFPIIQEATTIQADEMGHPLIGYKERINNSFLIGNPENIMLITGANMAGKSTFLRTIGVNLVLALSGSSVCARKFSCPIIALHTSMRATDSLVDHQSYFYAELSRLKVIMENVRAEQPVLVLLDEILRGTNSKDKQEGSIGLLKQFVAHDSLVMLASHDVMLGELEVKFPQSIRNYCFESEIENDALTFDYTLHKGIAHKANATFLMQKMGILPQDR